MKTDDIILLVWLGAVVIPLFIALVIEDNPWRKR